MAIDYDRMSPAEQAEYTRHREPPKSKYRNKKREYKGILYDSIAEADYAAELDALQFSGDIAWWLRQVWVQLGPDFGTRVDFLVALRCSDHIGLRISAHEVKGMETPQFRKVRKLWPKYAPMPMHVLNGDQWAIIEGKP